jgi:diguanylate cyclase (GGDEF)-like protein
LNSTLRSVLSALRHGSPVVLDVSPDIRYRLLQRYFDMSIRSSRLSALAFAIFLFGLAHGAPLWPRVAAVAALALAMHWRAGFAQRLLARLDPADPKSHRGHDLLVLATAVVWGAAPFMLLHHIPDLNLFGILYGALIPLAVICIGYIAALPAALLAVGAGALPLVVFMLLQQTLVLTVMGVATVMFAATMLARAATNHVTLLRALVAERDNAQLVLELQVYRASLETENAALGNSLRDASQAANHDPLTGLFNRRHLDAMAASLATQVSEQREPVTVCVVDVDHFKQINDRHGHLVGDAVLRAVAQMLGTRLRDGDCLARYGGEEFVAVLRRCDVNRGRRVAEALRHNVASAEFETASGIVLVTISVGVAQWAAHELLDDVIARADRALYGAKQSGRDRVEIDPKDALNLRLTSTETTWPGTLH